MSVEFIAMAAVAGIDPRAFAEADEIELNYLILVAEKTIDYYQIQQRNLAALIINYLGKALGGDKKHSGVS